MPLSRVGTQSVTPFLVYMRARSLPPVRFVFGVSAVVDVTGLDCACDGGGAVGDWVTGGTSKKWGLGWSAAFLRTGAHASLARTRSRRRARPHNHSPIVKRLSLPPPPPIQTSHQNLPYNLPPRPPHKTQRDFGEYLAQARHRRQTQVTRTAVLMRILRRLFRARNWIFGSVTVPIPATECCASCIVVFWRASLSFHLLIL